MIYNKYVYVGKSNFHQPAMAVIMNYAQKKKFPGSDGWGFFLVWLDNICNNSLIVFLLG